MKQAVDAVHRRRDPGDEDRGAEEQRGACVGVLDPVHTTASERLLLVGGWGASQRREF